VTRRADAEHFGTARILGRGPRVPAQSRRVSFRSTLATSSSIIAKQSVRQPIDSPENLHASRLTVRVIAGVMAITASTLFLQIALTKFFSFRLWYHYAFMIISITMLGLSASSVALALRPGSRAKVTEDRTLVWAAGLFGVSMLIALGVLVSSGNLLLRTGGR